MQQHHRTVVGVVLRPLLLLLLLPYVAVAQSSTPMVSTTPMVDMSTISTEMATTPPLFTGEQLGVLIGIPVALAVIIFIGVIIGCVVLHKVEKEEKLLNGKPYSSGTDRDGDTSYRPQQYYTDYLNSQTKIN